MSTTPFFCSPSDADLLSWSCRSAVRQMDWHLTLYIQVSWEVKWLQVVWHIYLGFLLGLNLRHPLFQGRLAAVLNVFDLWIIFLSSEWWTQDRKWPHLVSIPWLPGSNSCFRKSDQTFAVWPHLVFCIWFYLRMFNHVLWRYAGFLTFSLHFSLIQRQINKYSNK